MLKTRQTRQTSGHQSFGVLQETYTKQSNVMLYFDLQYCDHADLLIVKALPHDLNSKL
jgi:hypothetical protein